MFVGIHKKRNEKIILYKKYKGNELEYPNYQNYKAISIDKVKNIPVDYDGVMGVPITFINKYNPEQFEIVCSDYEIKMGLRPELVEPRWQGKLDRAYLDDKRLYSRLLIKNKKIF